MFKLHACEQIRVHLGLVEAKIATPTFFDPVHRGIGMLDELVEQPAILWKQRDAHADLYGKADAVESKRLLHLLQHAPRNMLRRGAIARVQIHHEFVATQTAQHVDLSQTDLQACGHQTQHTVAKGVPQRVVDDLEPVQIQLQNSKTRRTGSRGAQCRLHPLRQLQAVGQTGQDIVVRKLLNALAGGMLLRKIAHKADALLGNSIGAPQHHPRQFHGTQPFRMALQRKFAIPDTGALPGKFYLR